MSPPPLYKLKRKLGKRTQKYIVGPLLKKAYCLYYDNLAPDNKIIWINPWTQIDGFYRAKKEFIFEGQIKGGDWNKKTVIVKEQNCKCKKEFEKRIYQVPKTGVKFKGLVERFREKKSWRNTALFTEWYIRDLDKTLKIRRCRSLDELEQHYETRYDTLFENIKNRGILPACRVSGISPMYLCIGPKGEIFHYSGSHRLFIAMIHGIEKIPYKVLRRHKDWHKKRKLILSNPVNLNKDTLREFVNHPDIIDELATVFPVSLAAP